MSRTTGVTRDMMDAFRAADTLATVTLDLGEPLPAAPRRPRIPAPPAPDPARRTAGTGRHAKVATPPTRASERLDGRAVARLYRYRRPILAAVTVLVSGLIAGSLISGNHSPARPCAVPYGGQRDSDVCADVHDTVTVGGRTVSATPLAAPDGAMGALSVCSTVRLTNDSGGSRTYRAADFTIQAPSGAAEPPTSGTLAASGILAPGAVVSGTICDDRAVWSGRYAVIYQPAEDERDAQRGVWLTQR